MQQIKLLNYFNQFKKNLTLKCSSLASNEVYKIEKGSKITVTRKITNNDVIKFSKLTDDFNPIHINSNSNIVHGALLNGYLSGVLGTKLPGPGTIVAYQNLHYPKPCYPGDLIEITVEIIKIGKIITCDYKIIANSERIVLKGIGKFVMSKQN